MTTPDAVHEVHVLHDMLEDWFNGRVPAEALGSLLERFSDDFHMVGIRGIRLNKAALSMFFTGAHGSRPGLRIGIDALTLVAPTHDGLVVRYREIHDGMGAASAREALAIFMRTEEGALRWLALQETPAEV
ncbi:hypothetical protein FHW69_003496 [Luteibacter sp. Sphag1AF]|uniref:hypothetical protein n=1 Tax=Luteibacter sp. Sphag1AF TaxID=2587031 RepID=UPI00161EE673|nr:hypothetical protein [Luteibacter sp. Sphag1AF]MBB3228851.1 hypothetical protein [Luteibacter sp. Sphag1AF]